MPPFSILHAGRATIVPESPRRRAPSGVRRARKVDEEPGALPGRRLHPDRASHPLDGPLGDGEAEARPLVRPRAVEAVERLEQAGRVLARDADPAILHPEAGARAGPGLPADPDLRPLPRRGE